MIKIEVINNSPHPLPSYQTEDAAGMDLQAHLPEGPILLNPLERALIPTGLHIALPKGCEGQVRPRSGLAFRQGLTVLNSPGTIDADYRGEVKVLLINLSNTAVQIADGERIAQLVIGSYTRTGGWQTVDELSPTVRGSGGYGSTGK